MLRPLFALFMLALAPLFAAAATGNFLAELEDLPLAPGLVEAPGGLLFDTAGGRIVEAHASGEIAADQVRQFYEQSLRQLGWQSLGPLQFRRDNEILKITLEEKRPTLTVHFNLAPAR